MTLRNAGHAAWRQAAFPLILAVSLIAVLAYYVGATLRVAALRNADGASLALIVQQGTRAARAGPTDVGALAADPLDQQAVNGVIVARARSSGDMSRAARQVELLRHMGWRSTVALQNLLWRAAATGDQALVMDALDALLRRERLLGQIYPILNVMTLNPDSRALLVQRLAGRPPWRRYYLMSASDLVRAPEVEGRYLVMREVQRRGDPLARNEVAPILPKLIADGSAEEAFALWRANNAGAVTQPLADTDFAAAARPSPLDALPIPFEWQLGNGSGYSSNAGRDERGSFASVDWDGRGAPALMSQTTTARAGRYQLDVTGDLPGTSWVEYVGFSLNCPNQAAVGFVPRLTSPGLRAKLMTAEPVRCDFPVLQLSGLVHSGNAAVAVVLRTVRMERTGG
ncbi:hypothetical protein [Sphingomonas bacterium]|uniref:hypothetical protein n=1 Tax=Sphingomonas bacterium TaxID=1895847 RepID=UPI00157631DC|nr:hypothetical protein [Sphingomonas bacterium]